MKYYAVAEIEVTDPSWVQAYIENVTAMVERRGGRYLARTARIEKREGERTPPQIFLIIEWPSKAAADEFYASEEYRPHLENRRKGARSELVLVAGEDQSRAAARRRPSGHGAYAGSGRSRSTSSSAGRPSNMGMTSGR